MHVGYLTYALAREQGKSEATAMREVRETLEWLTELSGEDPDREEVRRGWEAVAGYIASKVKRKAG